MRSVVCLLMAVCLLFLTVSAFSEDLGDDYTQQEKLVRQVELGSGLRGALKVAVSGETGLAQLLAPLNNTEFQMRLIRAGSSMDAQLYAVKENQETGQTEIYMDGQNLFLKTSLLLGSILTLPDKGDLVSTLAGTGGNPSYLTFLYQFLRDLQTSAGVKMVSGTEKQIQTWLEAFAGEPEVTSDRDGTRMTFSYDVSSRELKAELKAFAALLANDAALSDWLRSQMSPEQAGILLDPNLQWYLSQVIDSLPFQGSFSLERVVNMQGEELESRMELPVADTTGTFTKLQISYGEIGTVYTLSGQKTLIWQPLISGPTAWNGYLSLQTDEGTYAVTYDVTSTNEKTVDAEDYHHDTTSYLIRLTTNTSGVPEGAATLLPVDPIELQLRFHYYSRSAKRSATTLDVTLKGLIPGGRIQAAAKFRTSTPWDLTPMETGGSISLADKSPSERLEVLQDLLGNLLVTLDTVTASTDIPAPAGADSQETEAADSQEPGDEPVAEAAAQADEAEEETAEGAEDAAQDDPEAAVTEQEMPRIPVQVTDAEESDDGESAPASEKKVPVIIIPSRTEGD